MICIPILGAAVSFIGAGLSFYFYWKNRTTPYKQVLYSKQLDGYLELSDIIEQIIDLFELKVKKNHDLTKTLEDKKEMVEKLKNIYMSSLSKWSIIFPNSLRESLMRFGNEFNPKKIIFKKIIDNRVDFYITAYREFGIEPFSEEMKKLIKR